MIPDTRIAGKISVSAKSTISPRSFFIKRVFLSLIWCVLKINTHPGVLIENTTEIQKFRRVSKFRTNTLLVNCWDQSSWASMRGRIDFENTMNFLYPRHKVRKEESIDFEIRGVLKNTPRRNTHWTRISFPFFESRSIILQSWIDSAVVLILPDSGIFAHMAAVIGTRKGYPLC